MTENKRATHQPPRPHVAPDDWIGGDLLRPSREEVTRGAIEALRERFRELKDKKSDNKRNNMLGAQA